MRAQLGLALRVLCELARAVLARVDGTVIYGLCHKVGESCWYRSHAGTVTVCVTSGREVQFECWYSSHMQLCHKVVELLLQVTKVHKNRTQTDIVHAFTNIELGGMRGDG